MKRNMLSTVWGHLYWGHNERKEHALKAAFILRLHNSPVSESEEIPAAYWTIDEAQLTL